MGIGLNIGFLHDILGFAVVPYNTACDPVKAPIVPLHDGSKRRAVTGARTLHQFGII
jgi:hypothetical protein